MYEIVYQPRMEDPVVVARFNSKEEAEAYMEVIKQKRPVAAPHHSCLLYTSPSPRDRFLSRMPSSA